MYEFKIVENETKIYLSEEKEIKIDTKFFNNFVFVENCKYKIAKWFFDNTNHLFTFNTNNDKIYFLDIILKKKIKNFVKFKDNDYLNLKKDNILIEKNYKLDSKYEIIKEIDGHVKYIGKSAGQEMNWALDVIDKNTNEKFILMFCKENSFTKIDIDFLNKIKEFNNCILTWYVLKNGYVGAHYNDKEGNQKIIYLHQLITNHYGKGLGQKSVDHINRDKLDNRFDNLRIVNQSIQNSNMNKKKRNKNAQQLPPEIKQSDIPIFVTYHNECYNKDNNKWRNYFVIEHPKAKKRYTTSKSIKISIKDKLQEAKDILFNIENDNVIKRKKRSNNLPPNCGVKPEDLPKYCYYTPSRKNRGDGFVIERHPNLDKRQWKTTESKKYTTLDKYNMLLKKLNELDSCNNI